MLRMIKYAVFGSMFFLCMSCGVIKGHSNPFVNAGIKLVEKIYPHDNPAEQATEKGWKALSGFDIDLSHECNPKDKDIPEKPKKD